MRRPHDLPVAGCDLSCLQFRHVPAWASRPGHAGPSPRLRLGSAGRTRGPIGCVRHSKPPKGTDMNTSSVIGRLTQDPELRELPSGTSVCKLRLAVKGMGRGGPKEVGYINVSTFGDGALAAAKLARRGQRPPRVARVGRRRRHPPSRLRADRPGPVPQRTAWRRRGARDSRRRRRGRRAGRLLSTAAAAPQRARPPRPPPPRCQLKRRTPRNGRGGDERDPRPDPTRRQTCPAQQQTTPPSSRAT